MTDLDDQAPSAPTSNASEDGGSAHPSSPTGTTSGRSFLVRHRLPAFGAAALLLLSVGAGSGALVTAQLDRGTQSATAFTPGSSTPGDAYGFSGGSGSASSSTSGAAGSGTAATAAQTKGVVTIDSTLGYESGEAAGTGIILTSSGRILTNNHVVEGSTSLKVTDESTGKSYTATVVGTDATDDIAVLQLKDASDLQVAALATKGASVGDAVTAVGNAGGTGSLTTASGSITAVEQSITTAAEESAAAEQLSGLLETNADIVAGDSGGPLTNSTGAVVGIDTAASSGSADVAGYAIPIADAMTIADEILAGRSSATITIGYPAFLGVEVDPTSSGEGAAVAQVIDGTPAATAGLSTGDTITAVDGTTVSTSSDLTTQLAKHAPGDSVRITYLDTEGASSSVTVTLTTGPAA